jgi:murein DD-endopeptidase MepM/ murein hydrolase activator NlpD
VAGTATVNALKRGRGARSSSSGSGSGSRQNAGNPTGPVRFLRPVHGPLTSGFGMRWGRMHTGLDFGAPAGAQIRAAGVGTVVSAGWNSGGYGNLVVVQHRLGYQTWYAHMSVVQTHSGAAVNGGSRLGLVGATGHVTGPHLHFEVRHNGIPINPLGYLLQTYAARVDPASGGEEPLDGCAPDGPFEIHPALARIVDCH